MPPASSAYPPAKVRSLYRQVLTLLRHAPSPYTSTTRRTPTQLTDKQLVQQQMRSNAPLTSADDIIIAVKQLMDKLTLLKFSTPKHLHRSSSASNAMQVDSILSLARDRQKLAQGDAPTPPAASASQSWYVDAEGNLQEGHSPSRFASSRANRAELGVTSEEIRRHQALTERMQFRGPHWEGGRARR